MGVIGGRARGEGHVSCEPSLVKRSNAKSEALVLTPGTDARGAATMPNQPTPTLDRAHDPAAATLDARTVSRMTRKIAADPERYF